MSPFDLITLQEAKRTRGAATMAAGSPPPPPGAILQRAREQFPPDAENNILNGVSAAAV